jgi:hypothetical protein
LSLDLKLEEEIEPQEEVAVQPQLLPLHYKIHKVHTENYNLEI